VIKILVIEDDSTLQRRLGSVLRGSGFDVTSADTVTLGLAAARANAPSLIVLDVVLPDGNGLDICRALRADPATAGVLVLMLSIKSAARDRVVGLDSGADDYVSKPYDPSELLSRVRALLRRVRGHEVVRIIECGRLRIDREAFRAWVDGRDVKLTALELRLLLVLYDRRDRVQTRRQLLEDVWDSTGAEATSTVDTRIKLLRKKLARAAAYVETMRGIGYRFCPPSS